MNTLLRKIAEWKGRRKAAQIIVFDGAAEIDRMRSFLKGAFTGIAVSFVIFILAAPDAVDPAMMREMEHRKRLVDEARTMVDDADLRVRQAATVAELCLATAEEMKRTIQNYQQLLGAPAP